MKNGICIQTSSERETERLGAALAKALEPGSVVRLCGNLGAGKTVIARGLARGLGIEENITSPTFVIMNRYRNPVSQKGFFHHFDLYRNPSPEEFRELGFTEILHGEGISAVEWAENLPSTFGDSIEVKITSTGENENSRKIRITASEDKSARIKKELRKVFSF